jgi:hypothetical protein
MRGSFLQSYRQDPINEQLITSISAVNEKPCRRKTAGFYSLDYVTLIADTYSVDAVRVDVNLAGSGSRAFKY